jgi:hypothetical protein
MWSFLRKMFAAKPRDPGGRGATLSPGFEIEVRVTPGPAEASPPHQTTDWQALPSKEKIKRVSIKPLPFRDAEVVETGSKSSKRFAVRLAKQKPGLFEFDEDGAITVFAVARGRQAALDFLAERICGGRCYVDDSTAMKGTCGRWYDGDIVSMRIVATEALR